jgi:hypothetical protein
MPHYRLDEQSEALASGVVGCEMRRHGQRDNVVSDGVRTKL